MNVCFFCTFPVTEKAIHSKTGGAVAHFECWYESEPFGADQRDPATGRLPALSEAAQRPGTVE